MSTLTIPGVLRGAAEHIQTHGWTRGAFYRPAVKQRVVPGPIDLYGPGAAEQTVKVEQYLDYEHAPACALGAIGIAAGVQDLLLGAEGAGVHGWGHLPEDDPRHIYSEAALALRYYLEVELNTDQAVPVWNDHGAVTVETVVGAFQGAAEAVERWGMAGLRQRATHKRMGQRPKRHSILTEAEVSILKSQATWTPTSEAATEAMKSMGEALAMVGKEIKALAALTQVPEALLGLEGPDPADVPSEDTTEVDAVMAIEAAVAALTEPVNA